METRLIRALGIAGAVFVLCLLLYTRHNDFPWFYHSDAKSKVRQVLNSDRNYHHLLLLLNAAALF